MTKIRLNFWITRKGPWPSSQNAITKNRFANSQTLFPMRPTLCRRDWKMFNWRKMCCVWALKKIRASIPGCRAWTMIRLGPRICNFVTVSMCSMVWTWRRRAVGSMILRAVRLFRILMWTSWHCSLWACRPSISAISWSDSSQMSRSMCRGGTHSLKKWTTLSNRHRAKAWNGASIAHKTGRKEISYIR